MTYVRYREDIEELSDDEAEITEKIIGVLTDETARTEKEYGRALRITHAKPTGLLVGELQIAEDLPDELRQGLFAKPGRYTALARVAQGPGEILDDSVSTHRGFSIKLIGVEGTKIEEDDERETQDFVLEAGETFPNASPTTFLQTMRVLSRAPLLPEAVKNAISTGARAANAGLEELGGGSRKLDFFGHPSLHPLAEAYFSQVPIRYGDYVAKIGLFPATPKQERLREHEIDASGNPDAFRDALVEYCRDSDAVFELRVQLATDLETMPIEDAGVEWPEEESPYRTVARLVLPAQNAHSEERRSYFDEALSFSPAHSLAAHRPLGSMNRARLKVYGVMSRLRHEHNGTIGQEPRSVTEIPE